MFKQPSQIIFFSGGIFTIIGCIAKLLDIRIAPWIFSVGVLFLLYTHINYFMQKRNEDIRIKRVARTSFFGSLFLALAAYCMFTNSNLWVVGVLIYALTTFYVSFRS